MGDLGASSEQLLVRRAADGDLHAFEALVRLYQRSVIRLCAGLLGDDHAAHDAAQDTFLAAWRGLDKYRGDAQFATWLYRIATNRCLTEMTRRRPPTVEMVDQPSRHGVPEDALEATESLAAVAGAINRLPTDERVALLLRDVEDLTYEQISEILGVSMAAVKSRIYRARVEITRHLGPR